MSNKLNDLHPQSDYDRNANLKETAGGQVEYGHLRSGKAKPTEMAISVSSYKRMLADPKRLQVAGTLTSCRLACKWTMIFKLAKLPVWKWCVFILIRPAKRKWFICVAELIFNSSASVIGNF